MNLRKKILILTSEPLNSHNVLSSTFELTQAQILRREFDVSILSVNKLPPFSTESKKLLKTIFKFSNHQNPVSIWKQFKNLAEIILTTLLAKVKRYEIEGIIVYEGAISSFISPRTFNTDIDIWTRGGITAFQTYAIEKGNPDIIHAHGRFLYAGALAVKIKQKKGIPFVYTEHSTYYQRKLAPLDSKQWLNKVIEHTSAFIAVSSSLVKSVETFLNKRISKTLVIPNVLDELFENTPLKNSLSEDKFVFLNIASLDEKKGIDVLLKAYQQAFGDNPNFCLNIIGEGPLKENLTKLTKELRIEQSVNFLGKKSKEEVLKHIDESYVFVLPSRIETFGVVVIEALSRGKPVIATISGGPEHIINSNIGVLIKPGMISELSMALINMTSKFPSYNRETIRNFTLQKYGSSQFLETMKQVYKNAIR